MKIIHCSQSLKRYLLIGSIGIFSGTFMVTTSLSAQSVNPILPEVVVTANRVETPLEQIGSTMTVITREQLQNNQDRFVSEALRQVPGVSVSRSGVTGSITQVRIRGAQANQTLVLIDGIEANDPAFGSSFDFANLLTADIERIEVLRGPQSALWGSDAIGGVINIITRKGHGALKGAVRLEGGSFDTYQVGANLGAGSDSYNYYLGATRLDTEGDSIAPNGTENDGYKNTTLSVKGGKNLTDNFSINLIGYYTSASSESDPQDFNGRIIDGDQVGDVEQFYGRAQAKLTLFEGAWEHILGSAMTDTDNDFLTDGIKTNAIKGRKIKYSYQTSLYFDTTKFAQAYHTLTFAVEREEEDFKQRGETPDAPQNQDQEMTNTSFIGEYRIGLLDQLFLTAAVRYDDNNRFKNETTYRLTGAYIHPTRQTRIHSSYGTGVKNPSFTELFGFFPKNFVGNPDLGPEKSEGWDIGIEQPLLNGRLSLDVTYFQNNFEDEIIATFDPDTSLNSVENSPGTSHSQGVEISARAQVRPNLYLIGSYTYLSSEDAEGQDQIRHPEHTASLTINYPLLDNRANINLGIDYVGEQKDLDFSTFPANRVTLDDYTLVNLNGTYRINDHIQIFGRIENLLDEDYQEVFGYATLGRGFHIGLKASR